MLRRNEFPCLHGRQDPLGGSRKRRHSQLDIVMRGRNGRRMRFEHCNRELVESAIRSGKGGDAGADHAAADDEDVKIGTHSFLGSDS